MRLGVGWGVLVFRDLPTPRSGAFSVICLVASLCVFSKRERKRERKKERKKEKERAVCFLREREKKKTKREREKKKNEKEK